MTIKMTGSAKGVTLIELMIVIAISAVLLSVSLAPMQDFARNRISDRLTQELQLDLAYARNQAITLAQEVIIEPNNNWSTGWRIRQGLLTIREKGSASNPMADAGIIISSYTAATPLRFDIQGRVNTPGSFTIDVPNCTGNRERTIGINFIGQIVVQESACQ